LSVVDHNAIELPRISEAEVGDYLALLKPRVMSLVIFTALVGLVIAPGHVHPILAFTSILCIAVGAGMMALAINVYRHREGAVALRATRKLFAFSIFYLFALFATLLLEVVVGAVAPTVRAIISAIG
jgi:heme o synthase